MANTERSILPGGILCALILAGCGGGGGGGKSSPSPVTPPTPAAPSVSLSVTTAPINEEAATGDPLRVPVSVQVSSQNLGSNGVYVRIVDNAATFRVPSTALAQGSGTYSATLALAEGLTPGTRTGTLTVSACQDDRCATPYAGASATLSYSIRIISVPDWETFQGNAAHSGYVPVRLDPSSITKAWEYIPSQPAGISERFNPVATGGGRVFLVGLRGNYTSPYSFAESGMYLSAINASDGLPRGTCDLRDPAGRLPVEMSPPAYRDGRAIVSLYTTDVVNTPVSWIAACDAQMSRLYMNPFAGTSLGKLQALTPLDGSVYGGDGYVPAYALDASNGLLQWKAPPIHSFDFARHFQSHAVDDNRDYFYSGTQLRVVDRRTGTALAGIDDPNMANVLHPSSIYNASPMISRSGIVVAYSNMVGDTGPERLLADYPRVALRKLVGYDVVGKRVAWVSAREYAGQPAMHGDTLYALTGQNTDLDAIDARTGAVLWSWVDRSGEYGTMSRGNVIATKTHLLFSASAALVAFNLAERKIDWAYREPGMLALSQERTLILVVDYEFSGRKGKVVGFKL